ncbi:MAG: hypothetical protein AABW67_00855 [Nanoarchaeota archaeon]
MKKRTRNIIGSIMIFSGLIGIILNSIWLAYYANPGIFQAQSKLSLIISIILVVIVWIGGSWGMRK